MNLPFDATGSGRFFPIELEGEVSGKKEKELRNIFDQVNMLCLLFMDAWIEKITGKKRGSLSGKDYELLRGSSSEFSDVMDFPLLTGSLKSSVTKMNVSEYDNVGEAVNHVLFDGKYDPKKLYYVNSDNQGMASLRASLTKKINSENYGLTTTSGEIKEVLELQFGCTSVRVRGDKGKQRNVVFLGNTQSGKEDIFRKSILNLRGAKPFRGPRVF